MSELKVIKRNNRGIEDFNINKILNAVNNAFISLKIDCPKNVKKALINKFNSLEGDTIGIEEIQDIVESILMRYECGNVAKAYIKYRDKHNQIREFAKSRQDFINKYKKSSNTANASIDDNSNVANKNIAVLNSELYKDKNIEVNRYRVMQKLQELYPDFDSKQYIRDLHNYIIYKNDENSTFGFPYCTAVTMYPFMTGGIKSIGGLSAAPHNLDSYCGMFVNFVFAISTQFAGAVATAEFLLCFDYFARKEWGDNYFQKVDVCISSEHCSRKRTIKKQIHQYFQQVVYSINQPAAARGSKVALI